MDKTEQLAKTFHQTYEKLAPKYGYKTREETRTGWDGLPTNNKKLMIAVAQVILVGYLRKPQVTEEWIDKKARELLIKANISIQTPVACHQQLKILIDFIRKLIEDIHVS